MRTYTHSKLVLGVVLFNEKLRTNEFFTNNFNVTPDNIERIKHLKIRETYVESIPTSNPEPRQNIIVVRTPYSNAAYYLDVDNESNREHCIFQPFAGAPDIFGFVDACEFFKRLRLKEQEFVDANKKESYSKLWQMFYAELYSHSLHKEDGKSITFGIVNEDFEAYLV